MINLSRRKFFIGAAALVAAPAVIRVAKLMPIKVQPSLQEIIMGAHDRMIPYQGPFDAMARVLHQLMRDYVRVLDSTGFWESLQINGHAAVRVGLDGESITFQREHLYPRNEMFPFVELPI